MIIDVYNKLPSEAIEIRNAVFVNEQGFENEFDEIDDYAIHLVAFESGKAIATCRFYWDDERKSYVVGRIAVVKDFRGQSAGSTILEEAEKEIKKFGGTCISLLAQIRAKEFYKKCGYTAIGECCYDEFCPHVWMRKIL